MVNMIWSGFMLLLLLLSGCGWDGTSTRHNDFVPLTSIGISADSTAIVANTSTRLTVLGDFSGHFTRDITDQVLWSSDSPTVAAFVTATDRTRVTALNPGTAILTATVGSVSSTFALTVSPGAVTKLTINPVDPTIAKGQNAQFTAIGTFSDLPPRDITFDVAWTSTDPVVATVSDAVDSKGFARAVATGTSTISATFSGVSSSTVMTVTEPVLQTIALSVTNPSILALSLKKVTATGSYSDGSTAEITSKVAWNSFNTAIATIAADGTVAALTQGATTISATLNGISGTTNLKVTGGNLTSITLSAANITPVNGTITLVKDTVGRMTATGLFSTGASRDITGAVAWSVANPAFATVATAGGNLSWLNALAATPATTVTAKSGPVTATINLTVISPTLIANGLTISPVNRNLTVKTSGRFAVTASFSDGTTQNVTAKAAWTSSNPTIASVDNSERDKGRVSGVAAGTATISAMYGGQTITAPVTVTARTLLNLTIPAGATVASGNQVSFTSTAIYGDGTSQDVTEDTIWTIDKPYVAIQADSQNQPGQVVGVDSGSATLSASFDGKTETLTVTVP